MNHLGTVPLETDRLFLRPFAISDAQAMFDNWASDPEVTRYLIWPTHTSIEVTQSVLSDWCSHYSENTFYQWAIVPKSTHNAPIGSISTVHIDESIQMVHIGYCIGRAWWRQGITSEALLRLLPFFFEEVGVQRIESRHDPRNPYSGAVMKKCGMKYEGTMRQADRNNQGICDCSYYAILASDYTTSADKQ